MRTNTAIVTGVPVPGARLNVLIVRWGWLVAVLALALANHSATAQSTIAYVHLSTPNPDPTFPWDFQGMRLSGGNSYNLDFNNDGTPEYIIRASGNNSPHSFSIYAQVENSVWVLPDFDSSLAGAWSAGAVVGPDLSSSTYRWEQNDGGGAVFSASIDVFVIGQYAFVDSAYCPLRFVLGGETHYGWVRVGAPLPAFNFGWIYDYAYDTRPDAAIFTGVPEPSTYALALCGAAGWLCFRRRRAAGLKTIVLLGLTVCALSPAHGQPLVNFNNGPGSDNGPGGVVRSPIYAPSPPNPNPTNHNSPTNIRTPGTREFTGALLAGPGYTAELWGGPLGSTEDSLVPLGATTFRTGIAAGFVVPVQLPFLTVPSGERATFQVRAWDNVGMTVTNWTQASSGNFGPFGSSALFSPEAALGGTPLNLIGLTSFELAIPEPSTWALSGAAAFAFWMLGRPKRMV